jgi:hypothetical protein
MGSLSTPSPQWWDRDSDPKGTPLRADVRLAAYKFWPDACRRATQILGNEHAARELLETSVYHVSHELTIRAKEPSVEEVVAALEHQFTSQLLEKKSAQSEQIQANTGPVSPQASVARLRRSFRWPREAYELVRNYAPEQGSLHKLIKALVAVSQHPADACRRFARQLGVAGKRGYKAWSQQDIDEFRRLRLANEDIRVIARKLGRAETSVRGMLHRLGFGKEVYTDTYSKYTLAQLLHTRPQHVQKWVDLEGLTADRRGTKNMPRLVIKIEDFIKFSRQHRESVLRGRVTPARLDFLQTVVFPANHAPMLAVRDSRRERTARARQEKAEMREDKEKSEAEDDE